MSHIANLDNAANRDTSFCFIVANTHSERSLTLPTKPYPPKKLIYLVFLKATSRSNIFSSPNPSRVQV